MKVVKVKAKDYFKDNNYGYIFGLEEYTEEGLPDYIEWFKTEKERYKTIKENKMWVIK